MGRRLLFAPPHCASPPLINESDGWLQVCGLGQGEEMIGSMRIESVSGPISGQEQAKEFYIDALGYELLVDDT